MKRDLAIVFLLAAVTLFVYGPVLHHPFISYDDPDYVTDNPVVKSGLTAGGVGWAFTTWRTGNWHPLTWLSHMLDVSLFDLRAGGHHGTSLLLHALNAAVLFLFLARASGDRAPSALVAGLFALHPLHVESVAWIAERKDVLCATLGLLALLAWTAHVRSRRPRAGPAYAAAVVFFGLGLLAKPMLVTLPLLLVLLDRWPFRRLGTLREKAPFFVLAAVSSVVTFLAQRSGGAVSTLARWPLGIRVENALVSYVRYLIKMIWPANLAIFYPMPRAIPLAEALGAGALLAALSALAILAATGARSRPYITTGWFWFLGMLVPVIGLVKIGGQSMADRYTYLPLVGIAIIAAWGLRDLLRAAAGAGRPDPDASAASAKTRGAASTMTRGARAPRGASGDLPDTVLSGVAVVLCIACAVASRAQLAAWKDSETLYTRAIDVTGDNALARYNLGCVYVDQRREDEAAAQFTEAIRIDPEDANSHENLGASFLRRMRLDEALPELSEAARLSPGDAIAQTNLGTVLMHQGRLDEALARQREAVRLDPDFAAAHINLGVVYSRLGHKEDALREYAEAVRLDPDSVDAQGSLGSLLANLGRATEALPHVEAAVRLLPTSANARANHGNVLLMLGRPAEAAAEYREALRLAPGDPAVERNLERALSLAPR